VAERQTREFQGLVSFGTWRFKSSQPHFVERLRLRSYIGGYPPIQDGIRMKLGDTGLAPRWDRLGRQRDIAVLAAALSMFAAVFALQTAISNPSDAPALLYCLPIALLASQFGAGTGIAAAVASLLLFRLSTEIDQGEMTFLGHVTRGTAFVLLGGMLGRFSEHLRSARDAVAGSQQQLQAILDNTTSVISLKDTDGRYLLVNNQFKKVFDLTKSQVVGQTDHDLFPGYVADAFRTADRRALKALAPVETEEVVPHSDGQHTYLSNRLPLFDSNGDPYAICSVSADISGRIGVESELLKSREQVRQIIDSARDAFVSIDGNGHITGWNRQAEKTFGWSFSEAIGRRLVDTIVPPRHRESHLAGLERFASGDADSVRRRIELTALHRDGREFPVEMAISGARTNGGHSANAFLHDITDRKDAEEKLRSSLAEISDLYENAPCGYHSLDPDGVIIRINDTELTWLGFTREEVVGKKKFSDLITDEGREVFHERFPRFKEEKRVADTEFEMVCKDGTRLPVLVSATAVTDDDGNFVMTRSMVFNLTERRRTERLAQLKSELELRAAELERSNAELAQFAHAASHDLAEPLRTVSSFVQLLANRYRGRLDGDADEFIGYTVEGVAQMQALIDGLLAYSTAGSASFVCEPVDCSEVVWRVLRALEVSISEAQAEIAVDSLPVVSADATHLAEVFQNLISNAIRFADGEAPRIHISAEREPKAWCFSVADNGIGIEPHHRQRIFDMFRRLHNRQAYPGTGIGLTICKKIVERQGGGIWVEENPDGGSIFRFTVPDSQDTVDSGAPGPERTSLRTSA
jgi:PAS domain S-box-containing protein